MSRRKVFALLTVGVLMTTLASAQTEEEIEDAIRVFHRGKTLHQEKRYEEAIREYRAALKIDRENPFLYNAMGLALAAVGNFQESLKAFNAAIQPNPDLTDVYNNMGMVYSETGEREKAFEAYGRAVRNPNYPTPEKALYNLGNLYLEDDNLERAHIFFERAAEKNPEFALAYRGLGNVLLAMDDVEGARRQFANSVEIFENDEESLFNLARIHESRGETEQALEFYRRVVEANRQSLYGRLALQSLNELKSP